MIRAAIGFFILGVIAILLGAYNVAGFSLEAGKVLLIVFVILAVITAFSSLFTGRPPRPHP